MAAAEAVAIGALAVEAKAKFNWGTDLLREARIAKNRQLSHPLTQKVVLGIMWRVARRAGQSWSQ